MSETIVFFGSGPVAAKSLALLAKDFEVEAVVTKPRPAHHKEDFPVLKLAHDLGIPTLLTADQAELGRLFADKPVKSRLAVVIDYGILIPPAVISYFPLGIVNSHFSLLPEWRGADPITFSVLSGQPKTGVSLMLIVEALDEGPLLGYSEYEIAGSATAPSLADDLVELSQSLLSEILPKYVAGEITPIPQESTGRPVSYSRKLTKADGIIDWNKPAVQLEREVRAYAGWPRSRTQLGETAVVITKSHVTEGSGEPGSLRIESKELGVCTADGVLVIDTLIPAGKKEMPAAAFLAGYKIN